MDRTRVKEPPTDVLLTAKDVADIFSVSTRTVARWYEQGIIPAPIHLGRTIRWRASDVQKHLDAQKAASLPSAN